MSALSDRIIGEKYRVERLLAIGGMGTLYVARHVVTEQQVAVKVLDRLLARDASVHQRFLREARLTARLEHPGIVRIYDAGMDLLPDGTHLPFLAMELLDGETLAQRLGRGNVTHSDALAWLTAILPPLACAHAQGIVHRDLKPENIFLQRVPVGEQVKLLDFGIARDANDDRHATSAGQALGTVYYMAPEQCLDARAATAASDVWSFGVMLYQCLTGRFPFDGESVAAVMVSVCRDPHRPLAEFCPELDPRLILVVEHCLRKIPTERYPNADALRHALAPIVDDPSVHVSLAAQRVAPWTFLSGDGPASACASQVVAAPAPIVDACSFNEGPCAVTATSPPPADVALGLPPHGATGSPAPIASAPARRAGASTLFAVSLLFLVFTMGVFGIVRLPERSSAIARRGSSTSMRSSLPVPAPTHVARSSPPLPAPAPRSLSGLHPLTSTSSASAHLPRAATTRPTGRRPRVAHEAPSAVTVIPPGATDRPPRPVDPAPHRLLPEPSFTPPAHTSHPSTRVPPHQVPSASPPAEASEAPSSRPVLTTTAPAPDFVTF